MIKRYLCKDCHHEFDQLFEVNSPAGIYMGCPNCHLELYEDRDHGLARDLRIALSAIEWTLKFNIPDLVRKELTKVYSSLSH